MSDLFYGNKDRANRIKKALGLNGEDKANKYYRVADVISDLMHFCDHYPYFKPDDDNITFDSEYQKGIEFYHEERKKITCLSVYLNYIGYKHNGTIRRVDYKIHIFEVSRREVIVINFVGFKKYAKSHTRKD